MLGAEEVPCFLEEPKSSSSYSSSSWFPFPALIVLRKGYHWAVLLNQEKQENFGGNRDTQMGNWERQRRRVRFCEGRSPAALRWQLVFPATDMCESAAEREGRIGCGWAHACLVSLLHLTINQTTLSYSVFSSHQNFRSTYLNHHNYKKIKKINKTTIWFVLRRNDIYIIIIIIIIILL